MIRNKEFEIEVQPATKIEKFKEMIAENQTIKPKLQQLIFSRKLLSDENRIMDYGIKNGSVIHLVLTLKGLTKNPEDLLSKMKKFHEFNHAPFTRDSEKNQWDSDDSDTLFC